MRSDSSHLRESRNENTKSLAEAIKKEALASYITASSLWRLALVTLPLDIVLLPVDLSAIAFADEQPLIPPEILWLLMFLGLAATYKEWWLDTLPRVRAFQQKAHSLAKKYPYLVVLLFMGFFFLQALLQLGGLNLSSLFIALAIAALTIPFIIKSMGEIKTNSAELFDDQQLWLKRVNQQVLLLHDVPCLAVRSISIVAALSLTTNELSQYLACLFASFFLLLALEPRREHFLSSCKGCASRTSRVLKSMLVCPACRPENFEKKVVAAEEKMAENELVETKKDNADDALEPDKRQESYNLEAKVQEFITRLSRHARREKSQQKQDS